MLNGIVLLVGGLSQVQMELKPYGFCLIFSEWASAKKTVWEGVSLLNLRLMGA